MPAFMRASRLFAVLALAALGGAAIAQNQFIFEPGVTPGFVQAEKGNYQYPTLTDAETSPTGKRVYFYAHGAWEFAVDCNTPGLYAVSLNMFVSSADYVTLSISARPETANGDPYATRYTSADTAPLPYTGEGMFTDFPMVTDVYGNMILLPLVQGRNVIRIQNVTGLHKVANAYPTDVSATDNRAPFPGANSGLSVSQARVTLDRMGDLPAYATVIGAVGGDTPPNPPAGTPVTDAIVTANPPGQSPTEINTWWKSGYWTITRPDGTYALKAPAGDLEVKAGRPSTYNVEGSPVKTVQVAGGGVARADLSLTSMWHDDGTGHPTISVQSEYWDSHAGGVALYTWDTHQNGMGILGYNGSAAGLALSYVVDAPQTGLYRATQSWNWGRGDTNHTRLTTNLGASTEMDLPDNQWAIQTRDYPDLLYLAAGRNVITTTVVSGDVGWDGLALTLTDQAPNVGTVTGVITDRISGQPVAGATVTAGGKTFATNASGRYVGLLPPGSYALSVSAPFLDAPVNGGVNIVNGQTTTWDAEVTIRPHITLSTDSGYEWKAALNTGGTADFSAVNADESAFQPIAVPARWSTLGQPEQIYGWYRLHFTVPAGFLNGLPGRLAVLRVSVQNSLAISDVDRMWLNGTVIGQMGQFPATPLDVQPADHMQPRRGDGTPEFWMVPPGYMGQPEEARAYYFPTSLLHAGDNVLAVKVYTNGTNDWIVRPGGIAGIPSLEIAGPTGVVTGRVTSGGSGLAGVRVAALDDAAIATDWALTDASGNYSLGHVPGGYVRVSAVKPGYQPASQIVGRLGEGLTIANANLDLASVPGGPAPVYDDFTSADWGDRWLAQSLNGADGKDPTLAPIVTIPGFNPNNPLETLPGTITIENTQTGGEDGATTGRWGALISKQRFSRYASVVAGRLVGLLDGTELDLFLLGSKDPDPTTLTVRNLVGFDIRPNLGSLFAPSVNGTPGLLWWIRNTDSPAEHASIGAVPGSYQSSADVTPQNPIDFAFTRAGSFWDLYLNGQRVWGGNLPMPNFGDHRISSSTWTTPSGLTWDWFRAGPTAVPPVGDLNGDLTVDRNDAVAALQIAGGLRAATAAETSAGNVAGGAGIGLDDAVRLIQAANGRPLP